MENKYLSETFQELSRNFQTFLLCMKSFPYKTVIYNALMSRLLAEAERIKNRATLDVDRVLTAKTFKKTK